MVLASGRHFRGSQVELVAAPPRRDARPDRQPALAIYRRADGQDGSETGL